MKTFEELGLCAESLEVLQHKGFEAPTPIQEKTIPAILLKTIDLIGQAQTGTGKTAAFGLPILELLGVPRGAVSVLVLTPTRELAIQVSEEISSLKGNKHLSIVPIYGGQSIELQLRRLKKGVDVVVGTPGRILDHLRRKTLKLDKISYLVLDEADEMLNMGFIEDVKTIMATTAQKKRTFLFSATMPHEILSIAQKYMNEYDIIRVTGKQLTVTQTDQIYFEVASHDRFEALCRIIDIEDYFYGLVFCRTKVDVDTIANRLSERGYDADALHGDMSQSLREKILNKFKRKLVTILVATDVAARGIDIQDLTHVINYALPQDPESYVHRIGRTGRAGKEGNAITFITPSEYRKLQFIQRKAQTDIRKAKLPKVKDVIETKKARIRTRLEDMIKSGSRPEYLQMSEEFLTTHTPESTVAALLEHAFGQELDVKSYTEIGDAIIDMKGKTRLFVTQGKNDGINRAKLINIIKSQCNIAPEKIRDVQILEKFSFISMSFHEAEIVLSYFKQRKKGQALFITKAKKDRKKK